MKLIRGLGLFDATCILIGTMIGTGVFLKTAKMTQQVGSPGWVILAWAVAGVLSLAGALTYAELGARFPAAGGEYVFLRETYGPLAGFLYGWTRFWIASPASVAAYAVGAATFISRENRTLIAIGMIAAFSGLNCLTILVTGRMNSFLTSLKILLVCGLTFGIFLLSPELSATGGSPALPDTRAITLTWSGFGTAVLAALWAFDGWNNLPMVAGEIKNPERNIPRALILGTSSVFLIYALANVAYFHALPIDEILSSNSTLHPDALPVATKAAQTFLGAAGITILSWAFVASALGAMNGSILSSARIPYAMAQDGLLFRWFGKLDERSRVPATSVLIQGAWSCVLAASGSFDQLTDWVVFSSWIFYGALGLTVIRTHQDQGKPKTFRTPGAPWLPAVFVVSSGLLLLNTIYTQPRETGWGLLFILAGIPVFKVISRKTA